MKNYLFILFAFFTGSLFSQTIQWQQLNGPFGGTTLSFASNSNGDIFAGADQDQRGIFRSSDGGLTWQPKSSGLYLENRAFSWLVVDDSSYIIAGTNSHLGSYVFKSTDNGESWTSIFSGLGGNCVAQNDSGHIYVGNTGFGQYSVSKDGGYTWTHYSHPSAGINGIVFSDSGHIFFVGSGIYRSTDNGYNWTLINRGLTDNVRSIAINDSGHLFAGSWGEYASASGIFKSTNNGDSWFAVKLGFRVNALHNIVINDSGHIIVGTWGSGVWKSTDNGGTWHQKNSGSGHFSVRSMHITQSGIIVAGLDGGGIYRSDDGGESWQQVGLTAAGVKRIAISPLNGNIFALVNGVSRSTDNGQTWEPKNSGLVSFDTRVITIKNDGTIFCGFVGNDYGILYRSTNNGDNWQRSDNGLTNHNVSGITFDTEGNVFVSIDLNGVYKSIDNGQTWNKIGNVPGGKLQFNSLGDLFLASYCGGLWILPAGDTIWVDLTSNYGSICIYTLFISKNDYLYTNGGRSTDNGLTWGSIPLSDAYSFAENSVGHLFAGTFNYGSGVKRSTDYGLTWQWVNSGIPTQDVRALAIDSDDYLYAGPWGYSLFKTTTPTVFHFDDPSLIAHYTFDGDAKDKSGYDNHGNVIGAVLTTDRFGAENSAYEFNGSSNYITVPNSTSLQSPTTQLTQLAWVNIYSWSLVGAQFGPVLMKSNSGENVFQYRLAIITNGVNTSINNWNNAVITPDTINFNQWYMITSVLKNDTVKHYINKKFIGSGKLTGPILLDAKPLEIGRDTPGATEHFHGKIDDIRIYNRALTTVEIDSLFDNLTTLFSEDNINFPKTFNLEQNYPNPFNPSTVISWQSPVSGWVTLKVFDVLGREVATLVDEYKEAGKYDLRLKISDFGFSSGVYYYRLVVSSIEPLVAGDPSPDKSGSGQRFVQTKKLILIK